MEARCSSTRQRPAAATPLGDRGHVARGLGQISGLLPRGHLTERSRPADVRPPPAAPSKEPAWQQYLRSHRPPTLITWGANDGFFDLKGARAYLADVPDAELHLLDTGHFALATHAAEIAKAITAFHASHAPAHPAAAAS